MKRKKGEIPNELVQIAIAVLILITLAVAVLVFTGKGGSLLSSLKNIFRFGR
jgi:hypothetical protein